MKIRYLIIIIIIIITNNVNCTVSFDLLEFIFGPKLQLGSDNNFEALDSESLIKSFGYTSETHEVLTEDGYFLTVHRIPYSIKENTKKQKPVVLIHHGFLGASDNWLFRGPDHDLPYILSDAGYDVWLCNARGNFYSRRHTNFDPNSDEEYWQFSFHEMGLYDLPATINYVLNITNESRLYFIGYSMGATASYILCSNREEYNEKLRLIISLAPTAYVNHKLKPFLKFLFAAASSNFKALKYQNIYEFMPRRNSTKTLLNFLCQTPVRQLCLSILFLAVGKDFEEFSETLIPSIIKYYPSGTSIYTIIHYYEMFTTGLFMPLLTDKIDGRRNNPEPYDVSKISAPVAIYFGEGDCVVTQEDCEVVMKKLPNCVGLFKLNHKDFNHLDFMWATNSKILLYDNLITIMNKFK